MSYFSQRKYNQSLELDYIKELYELAKVNEEFQTSQTQMSDITGIPTNVISRVMHVMLKNSLYTRRSEYYPAPGGQKVFWTLRGSYEDVLRAVLRDQKRRNDGVTKRNQNNVAIAKAKRVAITLPPTVTAIPVEVNADILAQAKNWVKAAKAYVKQIDAITNTLNNLKSAGMEVDEDGFYRSVNVKHDEKLSTIALVIPYIESLEKR